MPTRFNVTSGFGGFTGTPNPFIRMPDGRRMLTSDIGDARETMTFGGDGGPPRVATPRQTPSIQIRPGDRAPSRQAAPETYENSRGVTTNTPSATIYPDGPDYAGFRGDEFVSGNFDTQREQSYSSTPGAETARLEPSFLFGQPSVEVQTASGRGSAGNLDNEPSLFADVGANPFDQWWRTEPITASADVSASASANTGGSIWAGDDRLGNFNSDLALGNDLNADLGSLGYGEDYPAAAESPFDPRMADTGIPVEPDPLNQDVGDLEWTSTPGDRRFLPGSEPESVEPTPARSLAGPNIRNFGGSLSLGAFLNMPLGAMRYGTDRYQPQVQLNAEAQGGYNSSLGVYERFDPGTGEFVRTPGPPPADSPSNTDIRENAANSPGSGDFNTSDGRSVAGQGDFDNPFAPGEGYNLHFGQVPGIRGENQFYNYSTGRLETLHEPGSFSDSGNQGAEQQGRIRQTTTDAGHNQFGWSPDEMMILNSEGGFESRSTSRPTFNPSLRGWANLVTSARGRASAARGGGG